ncbi:ribonuclease E activity regulator RraA [Angustibacter speluncae]
MVQVCHSALTGFGGRSWFAGTAVTVSAFEDNALLEQALEAPGAGQVLVVDAGGTRRCAVLGDRMAAIAVASGWEGVVVHGCVRDVAALALLDLGVLALGACPRRCTRTGRGERDVPVSFGGLRCAPGDVVVADPDGLVVLPAVAAAASPS